MNDTSSPNIIRRAHALRSRRDILKLAGGGIGSLCAIGHLKHLAAQTGSSNAEIDALYDSAAAMPHLYAEFVFPFVRRNWEMNGRGTLGHAPDPAVLASLTSETESALLGEPDAVYSASFIQPAGESWSTARYLAIFNYATPGDAAAAATRFSEAGVPSGGADLTANLDPSLGEAISYAVTADLDGTPAEQVFSIFSGGSWLFRYYSLTPQIVSAAVPSQLIERGPFFLTPGNGDYARVPLAGKSRSIAVLPLAIGEEVADESLALAALALILSEPEFIREMLADKGYSDDEVNEMAALLFPLRFTGSSATRTDYPKHSNRDYSQFGMDPAFRELQNGYYAEAMCVVADEGPIPPGTDYYFFATKRFFTSADEASAFFSAQPTPAQDASHSAGGVTFQSDSDATATGAMTNYISWQSRNAPSTLPGYGYSQLKGTIVSHFNVYNVNPPPDGPKSVDPANPLYQALRTGVLDLLDQQSQFESSLTGWPIYQTPESFSG